jgi:hypothetical protein
MVLGATAVGWGAVTFPMFWQQAPVERIAARVVEGDPFAPEALAQRLPAIAAIEHSDHCRAPATHAAAVIRLRMAEDVFAAADAGRIDGALNSLRDSVRLSLACSPSDPFLWLILYWVENAIDGFRQDHLAYLRMSYLLGPNEGWIALKRSPFALAVYERLPPDMAEMAANEFARLLASGFVREAATLFTGPGWRNRNALLPRLRLVPEVAREAFARAVYEAGYDVDIPGVRRPDPRPWH